MHRQALAKVNEGVSYVAQYDFKDGKGLTPMQQRRSNKLNDAHMLSSGQ